MVPGVLGPKQFILVQKSSLRNRMQWLWNQNRVFWILAPLINSCVVVGELLNFSGPCCPQLTNGTTHSNYLELLLKKKWDKLWRTNSTMPSTKSVLNSGLSYLWCCDGNSNTEYLGQGSASTPLFSLPSQSLGCVCLCVSVLLALVKTSLVLETKG